MIARKKRTVVLAYVDLVLANEDDHDDHPDDDEVEPSGIEAPPRPLRGARGPGGAHA